MKHILYIYRKRERKKENVLVSLILFTLGTSWARRNRTASEERRRKLFPFYVLSFLFFSFIFKLNKYGIKQFGKGISIKKISRQRIFPPRRFPATDVDYQLVVVLRVFSPHSSLYPWNEEPRCVDLFVGPFRGPDGANTTETDCAARTGRVWGQIKNQFERTALIRKCSTGCSSSPDSSLRVLGR